VNQATNLQTSMQQAVRASELLTDVDHDWVEGLLADALAVAWFARVESQDARFAGEMTMTWTFAAVLEGTRVTVTAENVPPGVSKDDHDAGLRSSLENLARFLGSPS
jgi:hypothetical protein